MEITIEKPRLSLPLSLIIDDPAPCINTLYYYRLHVDQKDYQHHETRIPLDFLEDFIALVQARGIRGKFSVLPYPAGLGSILQGWEGCDGSELRRWLDLVREELTAQFDITPEILTHTLALDLATFQLLPEPEHRWMDKRNAEELTVYMSAALAILKEAGFQPTGITQPVTFTGDRAAYSQAVLDSIRQAGGPQVTFQFIDFYESGAPYPFPKIARHEPSSGRAVVDILSMIRWDPYWQTMRPDCKPAERCADYLISADGTAGVLAELVRGGGWGIYTTHWQSLYSDGTRQGLVALELTAERLQQTFGERLQWMTLGEVSRYAAASATCQVQVTPGVAGWTMKLSSPFACPDFTFSVQAPELAARPLEAVRLLNAASTLDSQLKPSSLTGGLLDSQSWIQDGERLILCLNLPSGETDLSLQWR